MKILIVGYGRMGSAMVTGWLKQAAITAIDIIEPTQTNLTHDPRLTFFKDAASWGEQKRTPDIVVLAVKPQAIAEVNTALPPHVPQHIPVLSIAAGITLTNLTRAWGDARPIIRAMPNTPASIGMGATACILNNNIQQKHIDIVSTLLSTLGSVYQVSDEIEMDGVTALSGSGPAYLFHFVEALENAGKKIGLTPDLARSLARDTVIGAAALLAAEPDSSPTTLRENVTSPGGTTEAGLKILMGNQMLEDLLTMTLKAAFKKSQELAQN